MFNEVITMNWQQNILVLCSIIFFSCMTEYMFTDIKRYLKGKEHSWVTPRPNNKLMAIEASVFAITTMIPMFFTVKSIFLLISIPVIAFNWICHFMIRRCTRELHRIILYALDICQGLLTWGMYFLMIM